MNYMDVKKNEKKNPGTPAGHLVNDSEKETIVTVPQTNLDQQQKALRNVVNIARLSQKQLLHKLKETLQSMADFTLKTRNAHERIKDDVASMVRIFNCYALKVRTRQKGPVKSPTEVKCLTCDMRARIHKNNAET